jgi:hypothetical protein
MMIRAHGRGTVETWLAAPPIERRDRAAIALGWAIAAALAAGLVWLAVGAGPAIHDMPDEASTMIGLPLAAVSR